MTNGAASRLQALFESDATRWYHRLLAVLILALVAAFYYWPYLHTFIGTDVGCYWEIARRIRTDQHLTLYGNYWDNKPLLNYLFFLPFQYIESHDHEMIGLKVSIFCFYLMCALGVFVSLERMRSSFGIRDWLLAMVGCSMLLAVVMSWADHAQNAMPSVGSICLAGAGMLLVSRTFIEKSTCGYLCCSGFLLGTSVFFRLTGATGIVWLLTVTLGYTALRYGHWVKNDWEKHLGSALVRVAAWTALAMLLLFAVTVALGSSPHSFFEAVIAYNIRIGAERRSDTGLLAFFMQDHFYFVVFVAFVISVTILCLVSIRQGGHQRSSVLDFALIIGYLLIELWGAVFQRTIRGHYIFHFVLPGLLALLWANRITLHRAIGAVFVVAMAVVIHGKVLHERRLIPDDIYKKGVATEREVSTGLIVEALAEQHVSGGRLLVVGSIRPNLYTLAARKGIRPYDFTVYMPFQPKYFDRSMFETWLQSVRLNPPEYLVLVDWTKRAFAAEMDIDLWEGMQSLVREFYKPLRVVDTKRTEWPYQGLYRYQTYVLRSIGLTLD